MKIFFYFVNNPIRIIKMHYNIKKIFFFVF